MRRAGPAQREPDDRDSQGRGQHGQADELAADQPGAEREGRCRVGDPYVTGVGQYGRVRAGAGAWLRRHGGEEAAGEPADVVGPGSSPSVGSSVVVSGTVGRVPAGRVAPSPESVELEVGVGVGDGDDERFEGLAVILIASSAAGGAVASLALAVAVRVMSAPVAALLGTAAVAWSSSEVPLAIPPTVQVRPLAVGHTVNLGVTFLLAALPLMVTDTPLDAPPADQTQIA